MVAHKDLRAEGVFLHLLRARPLQPGITVDLYKLHEGLGGLHVLGDGDFLLLGRVEGDEHSCEPHGHEEEGVLGRWRV